MARSDSKNFLTICLIWYSGNLKDEGRMTFETEILDFMPWLESPFIALQSIKGNVTLVIMRPLGVLFAQTILDTPKTSNIASTDHYSLACFIFPQKLIFRKVWRRRHALINKSGFRIISSINLRFASIDFVACCFSAAEDMKSSLESSLDRTPNFCQNLVIFRSKNMYLKESLTRSSTVI